jgi:peptidoglycan/xylan/chitin deacetylase (PgdA/CDA1 family)
MFHHIQGDNDRAVQGVISRSQFHEIVKEVGLDNILPAKEWLDRAINNTLRETDVCLTFDDALRCQMEHALPILQEYGLTAFWFVYTAACEGEGSLFEIYGEFVRNKFDHFDQFFDQFCRVLEKQCSGVSVEELLREFPEESYLAQYSFYSLIEKQYRYLRDQVLGPKHYSYVMEEVLRKNETNKKDLVRKLWMDNDCLSDLSQRGHVIGLHSYSHPTNLVALSLAQQHEEYRKNLKHIMQVTGSRPTTMAHPVNSYGRGTLRILKELGIKLGFRSNMEFVQHDGLEHPREDVANLLTSKNPEDRRIG